MLDQLGKTALSYLTTFRIIIIINTVIIEIYYYTWTHAKPMTEFIPQLGNTIA